MKTFKNWRWFWVLFLTNCQGEKTQDLIEAPTSSCRPYIMASELTWGENSRLWLEDRSSPYLLSLSVVNWQQWNLKEKQPQLHFRYEFCQPQEITLQVDTLTEKRKLEAGEGTFVWPIPKGVFPKEVLTTVHVQASPAALSLAESFQIYLVARQIETRIELEAYPTAKKAIEKQPTTYSLTPYQKLTTPLYSRYTDFSQANGFGEVTLVLSTAVAPQCRLSSRGDLYFTRPWRSTERVAAHHYTFPLNQKNLGDMAFLASKQTTFNLQCRHETQPLLDIDFDPFFTQELEKRR